MFWSLLLRQSLRALWRNRLRSFLTLLGIMIGVASFICVVGVGSPAPPRLKINSTAWARDNN